MRTTKIRTLKNQALVADSCWVAESFVTRLRGLIGTQELKSGEGLLLNPCNDIHMWFMSIPIDVLFLAPEGDGNFRVTSLREHLKPWKLFPVRDGKATMTLELPIGTIKRCNILPGDSLCSSL